MAAVLFFFKLFVLAISLFLVFDSQFLKVASIDYAQANISPHLNKPRLCFLRRQSKNTPAPSHTTQMNSTPEALAPQVHLHELILLIHQFLIKHKNDFPQTSAAFEKESAPMLGDVHASGQVKPLELIMNEYLELAHAKQVRRAFVNSNASAILEPQVNSTLNGIARLLEDYRILREAPSKTFRAENIFDDDDVSDIGVGVAVGQIVNESTGIARIESPNKSSSSSSSSSSSAATTSSSNIESFQEQDRRKRSVSFSEPIITNPSPTGRRKRKVPRRRRQTGTTSVVLGKRTFDNVIDSESSSNNISTSSNRTASSIGNGRDMLEGINLDMSLDSLDVKSLMEDPNLPDMLASQINKSSAGTPQRNKRAKLGIIHSSNSNSSAASNSDPVSCVLSALGDDPGFANIVARSSGSGSPRRVAAAAAAAAVTLAAVSVPVKKHSSSATSSSTVGKVSNSELLKMDVDELLDMADDDSDDDSESESGDSDGSEDDVDD